MILIKMGCWKYNLSNKNFDIYQDKLFEKNGQVIRKYLQSISSTTRIIPWISFPNMKKIDISAPPACGLIHIPYDDYGHCVAFYWDQTQLFLFDPALSRRPTRKSKQHEIMIQTIGQQLSPTSFTVVYSEELIKDQAPWQLDSQSLYDGFCHTYSLVWLRSVLHKTPCFFDRSQLHTEMIDLARFLQTF